MLRQQHVTCVYNRQRQWHCVASSFGFFVASCALLASFRWQLWAVFQVDICSYLWGLILEDIYRGSPGRRSESELVSVIAWVDLEDSREWPPKRTLVIQAKFTPPKKTTTCTQHCVVRDLLALSFDVGFNKRISWISFLALEWHLTLNILKTLVLLSMHNMGKCVCEFFVWCCCSVDRWMSLVANLFRHGHMEFKSFSIYCIDTDRKSVV